MAIAQTYVPIATYTGSGTVTFSSIPQTYTDLIISLKGTSTLLGNLGMRFNGDSGTNYSRTMLYSSGSGIASYATTNYATCTFGDLDTSFLSQHNISIMNYSNSTTYKTMLGRWNNVAGTYASEGATVQLWKSTSAINSISMISDNGTMNSVIVTLYGIASA